MGESNERLADSPHQANGLNGSALMVMIVKKALILTLCWTAFGIPSTLAQKPPNEYEVKSACLYNFLKYVEWPAQALPDPKGPFLLGVLGDDPFGKLLDNTVADKSIDERKIMVRRSNRLEDLKTCHLLFVSQSEKSRVKRILADLKDAGVLTVGEFDTFAHDGGMINFTRAGEKVRFEINLNAAQRSGLKISPKLLNVAKIISPPKSLVK
jgi:hypothetical protein